MFVFVHMGFGVGDVVVPEAGALILIGFAKPEGGTGGFARYIAVAPASWPHGVTIKEAPGAPLPTQSMALRRSADGVLRRTELQTNAH